MDGFIASPADHEPILRQRELSVTSRPGSAELVNGREVGPTRASLPDLTSYRERFRRSLDQLNRGEMDEMLTRYSDEVTLLMPAPKPSDPVRERMIHGKAGFQHVLGRFLAAYAPLRLLDVQLDPPNGVCALIECRGGVIMTYRLVFDAAGLGRRVVVSIA